MVSLFLYLALFKANAADLYVKSLKAPLLEEAKASSKIKLSLERDAQVKELGKEGVFFKVKAQNQEGFINGLFLSSKPVDAKNSSILNEAIDISAKARKRASGFTSAAAARGLKEDSDDIFKSLGDANPIEIKKMESLIVGQKQGIDFLTNPNQKLQ